METQFNEERKRWKDNSASEYDRIENMRRRDKEQLEEQLRLQKERSDTDVS